MLSEKIKKYLKKEGLYDDTEDTNYQIVMKNLGIDECTAFAEFNLHTNAVTFSGQSSELYNVCWFAINSMYYEQITKMQSILNLSNEYLPLDSFEGEGGFFYNRKTEEVLEIELGTKLNDFHNGKLSPQWKDFNSFLEWFFKIE